MTRALQLAGIVALLAWALVGVQLVYTLERVNEASVAATSAIQETQRRVAHTSQNANAVIVQLGLAADQWRLASLNQAKYARQLESALDETTNMVREGRKTLEVAREQISRNGNASELAILGAHSKIQETGTSASAALRRIDGLIVQVGSATVRLDEVVNNAADTAAHISSASGKIDGTAANLRSATESVDQALKPLRTTQGKLRAVLKFLLGLVKVNIR